MTRVVLHIDRLVLRGMQRSDAAALTAGLQAALAAGWSAQAPGFAPSDVPVLKARVPSAAEPGAIGRAVAGCIVPGGQR